MFNERDRRCAAVQFMLSTDPNYDNRTIASTLKMQIRTVQRAQGDENKVSGYGYGLWCGFKWGPHHPTSHLRSRLESQHQSVPGCTEECGDLLVHQVAVGRHWVWQQDSAPVHKSKQTQAWLQKECYDFVSFSHCTPSPLTWTRWTTSFGHTSRTSPTWPPTTPKPAWSPPSAEYSSSSRRRLRKRHAPSSGSVSRRWLRLKVATLNRCQLYYIIKLPKLIFSIKVLK